MSNTTINTIVFDLGGVLIDWSPRYLYDKVFNGDIEKSKWFLENICTPEWNVEQDAGKPLDLATSELIKKHPDQAEYIQMYYDRWQEMLGKPIKEIVHLLERFKFQEIYKLYALTNWSDETFPVALERFDFLNLFEGIVVSGQELTRKPFPKIYQILMDRYEVVPHQSVFIDDNLENVLGAKDMGFHAFQFKNPEKLFRDLKQLGIQF
ncbi:HAD family hydrolase [Namhaeicola litoreus]|uniref:HAD family hydrolase n=1 Tax=Namhaeicola litoreus TaxID=1052145 RepID=A0ABW3Y3J5_9FLAO